MPDILSRRPAPGRLASIGLILRTHSDSENRGSNVMLTFPLPEDETARLLSGALSLLIEAGTTDPITDLLIVVLTVLGLLASPRQGAPVKLIRTYRNIMTRMVHLSRLVKAEATLLRQRERSGPCLCLAIHLQVSELHLQKGPLRRRRMFMHMLPSRTNRLWHSLNNTRRLSCGPASRQWTGLSSRRPKGFTSLRALDSTDIRLLLKITHELILLPRSEAKIWGQRRSQQTCHQ